jgi:hypothetical protein
MVALRLTTEQRAALGALPEAEAIPVFDPGDNRAYFLVPAEIYERLRNPASNEAIALEPLYPLMDEVAAREGWNDPDMDVYNQFDPRKQL